MNRWWLAPVAAAVVTAVTFPTAVSAPVAAQTAAPAAPPGAAVVLEVGQAGTAQGITGNLQGVAADAVLEAVGEALQARGVSVRTRTMPGVPTLDVAGQLSVTQRVVVLAQQVVVDATLYARLTNPDGSAWYAHGAGSATVTALTNPYGYGGYWGQVPAGAVLDAVRRAAAELVPQVVARLGAAPAPPPCSGTRTAAQ